MKISLNDFASSDVNGVVSYRGKPIAARLKGKKKGWFQLRSESDKVDKAVSSAIFGSSNDVSAYELRRKITDLI